jgi:hypothetical protein
MRAVSPRRRFAALAFAVVLPLTMPAWGAEDMPSTEQEESESAFPGLDESVNEALAAEAGVPSRDPLINTEAMGELWNLLLLVAGGVCGFIIGRYWDQLWGRAKAAKDDDKR